MPLRVPAALLLVLALSAPAAAARLPSIVTPTHYDLTFAVDLGGERFEGTETIRVTISAPTRRVVLNALDLDLRSVTMVAAGVSQTAAVSLDADAETATLAVLQPLPAGPAEILIRYTGRLNDNLRGFYLSKGPTRTYAVTQFESTDARRAFPCFDEPAFKATFGVTLVVDRGDTAISNGRLVSDVPGPTPTQHTLRFAASPKMSSYLVAMAVGDFQCLDGGADGIPIRICATPDKKELGHIALEAAQQVLSFYNRYYTIKYPFEKLDVVAVPDFAAGAMENTAAIFFRETDLLAEAGGASVATRKQIASILAHEMAHQWFGDLVTMQWWDDLWLNEGFATWMANLPLAAWKPGWHVDVDEALETQTALNLDSLTSTHAIRVDVQTPAQIEEAFDAIAYEKGAAVLRMVERYVGAETFRKGVNVYLERHAYGNATSLDFWTAIAATSGTPMDRVLPTFVNQPGFPVLDVSWSCASGRTEVQIGAQRFPGGDRPSNRGPVESWQVPVCVKADGQRDVACHVLTGAKNSFPLPHVGCASWVFANAGAQGYYRTAYPPDMIRALAPHVEDALTAPERVSLVADEWALVRAGRHTVADYLTLVSGFGRERTSGVLGVVAERFAFVHEYVAAGAARARFEDFVRALLRPALDEIGFAAAAGEDDERRSMRGVRFRPSARQPPIRRSSRDRERRSTPRWAGARRSTPPPPRRLWRSPSSTAMPRCSTRCCAPPGARSRPTSTIAICTHCPDSAIPRSSIAASSTRVRPRSAARMRRSTSAASSRTRRPGRVPGRSSRSTGRNWSRRSRSLSAT